MVNEQLAVKQKRFQKEGPLGALRTVNQKSLLSKLGFEFTLFCHPELVSGSRKSLILSDAEPSSA